MRIIPSGYIVNDEFFENIRGIISSFEHKKDEENTYSLEKFIKECQEIAKQEKSAAIVKNNVEFVHDGTKVFLSDCSKYKPIMDFLNKISGLFDNIKYIKCDSYSIEFYAETNGTNIHFYSTSVMEQDNIEIPKISIDDGVKPYIIKIMDFYGEKVVNYGYIVKGTIVFFDKPPTTIGEILKYKKVIENLEKSNVLVKEYYVDENKIVLEEHGVKLYGQFIGEMIYVKEIEVDLENMTELPALYLDKLYLHPQTYENFKKLFG